MSSVPETVAETIVEESRQKRRRIAGSLWPRARLIGEILYRQLDRDRLFTQAAALTYKTLFSLLPIFVLTLLVLSAISAGDGKNALDSVVKDFLFKQLPIQKFDQEVARQERAAGGAEGAASNPGAAAPVQSSKYIEEMVENAKNSITNKATGLVAFAILLYGAISLMIVIESTFNQMYGSAKARSWPRRIMLYWCVLTLGPIGVAASIVLGRSAMDAATGPQLGWLLGIANALSGFVVSWLAILLMYRLIPETHVNWRPAVIGSFLAATAWELGKWGFGLYVHKSLRNNWYGPLALLPLFMLWIYLTWSVVLLGLEITYMQQYWRLLKRQFFFTRTGHPGVMLSDLRWVLALGTLIYHRFKAGKSTAVHEAAEALMLPNDITGELMVSLEKAGLVHDVRGGGYTLARPPEEITAHDLLMAARAMCQVPPELARESKTPLRGEPEFGAVRELEDIESRWASTRTLAQMGGGTGGGGGGIAAA